MSRVSIPLDQIIALNIEGEWIDIVAGSFRWTESLDFFRKNIADHDVSPNSDRLGVGDVPHLLSGGFIARIAGGDGVCGRGESIKAFKLR
jgi:hypothetical protein